MTAHYLIRKAPSVTHTLVYLLVCMYELVLLGNYTVVKVMIMMAVSLSWLAGQL